jgi:hypothetical protein
MKGSGGTYGGFTQFTIGFFLAALATFLFLNSVYLTTLHVGIMGRAIGGGHGGWGETTSMGILFVPFFISLIALFYDARLKWAWWLLYIGLGILVIEILSRVRFRLEMKVTSLLLMIVLFSAGVGLILRSYRDKDQGQSSEEDKGGGDDEPGGG